MFTALCNFNALFKCNASLQKNDVNSHFKIMKTDS